MRISPAWMPAYPELAAKRWFVSSLPLLLLCYLVDFCNRGNCTKYRGKMQGSPPWYAARLCLITFTLNLIRFSPYYTHHKFTMVAASKAGATSQAIKYEPLKCDCKLTKRKESLGSYESVRVESSSDIFLRRKNDKKQIARCQKIILVPKADTIENVVIFCTFGAWITGNYLEDTQLGVKHYLLLSY